MNNELICPICGEPTNVYMGNARKDRLCRSHAKMLKEGLISRCEDCGAWHKANEVCACKKPTKQGEAIIINEQNKSRCITCGRKTDGLLFCNSCYKKYCNKELLFKITKCSSVQLLDESYEGKYVCADGHIVKSKSERDIDNYLFKNRIPHAYEKTLSYGKSEKEILHPDFFLPGYLGVDENGNPKDVYIEHWGYEENNRQYTESKKFKIEKYKGLNITLICTYEKTDISNIDASLDRKLNKNNIDEGKINYEN